MSGRHPPHLEARIGLQLGEWIVGPILGVGGMGCVYAVENATGERAAIKILHPEASQSPDLVRRFAQEGAILQELSGQPASLRFFGGGRSPEGAPFLVLERLEGRELTKHLRESGGKLPVAEVVAICAPILALLDHCHAIGVVHRDLKPANVFLCHDGRVRLLDFGIARARTAAPDPEATAQSTGSLTPVDADLTRVGTVLGTASYMAPEQALGRTDLTDARADIFAMGAMLYQLLSGERLREGKQYEELHRQAAVLQPESLARVAPDLPAELISIVDRATSFDPGERYQTAGEMRDALLAFRAKAGEAAAYLTAGASPVGPASRPALHLSVMRADEATVRTLRGVFRTLELSIEATGRYGWQHPEAQRRFDQCFEAVSAALLEAEDLRWEVRPSGFTLGEEAVWRPEAPFDTIPYSLFGSGVHEMQLLHGVPREELGQLIRFLASAAPGALAQQADLGVELWEQGLSHLKFQLVELFEFDDQDPSVEEAEKQTEEERQELALLLASMGRSAETESDVLGIALERRGPGGVFLPCEPDTAVASHAVDLGLRWEFADRVSPRLPTLVASALHDANRVGDREKLSAWMGEVIPACLHASQLRRLVASSAALLQDLAPTDEAFVSAHLLNARNVAALVSAALQGEALRGPADETLFTVLGHAGSRAFEPLLGLLPRVEGPLEERLVEFLFAHGAGAQAFLGGQLRVADGKHAAVLLRLLDAHWSPPAAEALREARWNRHEDVRWAAFSLLARNAPDRVTAEDVEPWLAHPDPSMRIALLRLMGSCVDRGLVPLLELRILAEEFEALPNTERRLLLEVLHRLDEPRAETVLMRLLGGRDGPARTPESTSTRLLAVLCLGQWGKAAATLQALEALSQPHRGSTPEICEAASRASEGIRTRTRGQA